MTNKVSALLVVAFFGLFQPVLTFAQQTQQPSSPTQPFWNCPAPWHMWGGGWGFWWIFPLFMLLFILMIGVAIFFLGHRSGGGRHHWGPWQMMDRPSGPGRAWGDPTYSALQVLNERFAKGEIPRQEYEEKKTAILSSGQS